MLDDPSFWTFISFLIFVLLTFVPIKKALLTALDKRAKKIQSDIEQALKLREEAQELLASYQRKQRDGVKEAENLVKTAKEEGQRMVNESTQKLTIQLARRESIAAQRIKQAENMALQKIHNHAVDVAISATKSIFDENISKKKSRELIKNAINELPENLH